MEGTKPPSRSVRSLILAVLFTLAVLAVIVIGLLSVKAEPIESFLPQAETVGFLEFEEGTLPAGLQTSEGQTVIPALQALTHLPLSKLPASWWDHPFGVALIQQEDGSNAWVFFAEGPSRRQMMKDLQSTGLENGGLKTEEPLYTYAQGLNFNFGFSNHHVFITHNPQAIDALKAVELESAPVLLNDALFQKAQSHTSARAWVRGYAQTEKIKLPEYPAFQYAISSMSHVAGQVMLSVREQSGGLQVGTWVNLNEPLKEKQEIGQQGSLEEMAQYIPYESAALFVAGPNLTQQWQNTLTQLSELNPAYGVVLESLVRAQVQDFFGGSVDLRNDLYPLFEGRYALALGQGENGFSVGMVVEHNDKGFAEVKLDKLLKGFYALVGKLNPQVKVVDLPDGTQSRELVANSQNADELQEEYAELNLTCLSAQVKDFSNLKAELLRGFCYTTTPERFYLATSQALLKQMLDATNNDTLTLGDATEFKQALAQTSNRPDQLTYLNMAHLAPLLAKTAPVERTEVAIAEAVEEEVAANPAAEEEAELPESESESAEQTMPAQEAVETPEATFLLTSFLGQLGQSTWVKHSQSDGVSFEGFVGLE